MRALLAAPLLAACGPMPGTSPDAHATTGTTSTGPTSGDHSTANTATATTETTAAGPTSGDPSTDSTGTTATAPSSSTTLPPDAQTCSASDDGCFCWAEDNGGFETMVYECHDICVDDEYSDGFWADAWCADTGACCNPDAVCMYDLGVCVEAPRVSLADVILTANCDAIPPADPIAATFTLNIDNTTDLDFTLHFIDGTLASYSDKFSEQVIAVAPTDVGPTPAFEKSSTMLQETSVQDPLPDDCAACGEQLLVTLSFASGEFQGVVFTVEATAMLACRP